MSDGDSGGKNLDSIKTNRTGERFLYPIFLCADHQREFLSRSPVWGKIWAATRKGRQIGSDQKFSVGEFASHIEAENSFDGAGADLEFSVIVRFGTSIRKLTDDVCNYIAETLYEKQGRKPNQIKIHIVGVRSRQTARRSLEVIKRYGAD